MMMMMMLKPVACCIHTFSPHCSLYYVGHTYTISNFRILIIKGDISALRVFHSIEKLRLNHYVLKFS